MASTNKTSSYGLTQFVATDKPSWLTDYNGDMNTIDGAIAASGVHPAVATKAGNQHTVVFGGEGDMCRFTATADFNKGDTLKLNGAVITVLDCDGNAFVGEAWKTGDRVVLAIAPTNVRVLAPLRNKANVGVPEILSLDFVDGVRGGETSIDGYYKDHAGRVYLSFNATCDGGFTHALPIAFLPKGYRPAGQWFFPAAFSRNNGSKRFTGICGVLGTGGIQALNSNDMPVSEMTGFHVECSYLAEE